MIIAAASSSPVLSTATADQSRIARPKSSRIKSLIVSIATPLAYRGADCPPLLLSTRTITGLLGRAAVPSSRCEGAYSPRCSTPCGATLPLSTQTITGLAPYRNHYTLTPRGLCEAVRRVRVCAPLRPALGLGATIPRRVPYRVPTGCVGLCCGIRAAAARYP